MYSILWKKNRWILSRQDVFVLVVESLTEVIFLSSVKRYAITIFRCTHLFMSVHENSIIFSRQFLFAKLRSRAPYAGMGKYSGSTTFHFGNECVCFDLFEIAGIKNLCMFPSEVFREKSTNFKLFAGITVPTPFFDASPNQYCSVDNSSNFLFFLFLFYSYAPGSSSILDASCLNWCREGTRKLCRVASEYSIRQNIWNFLDFACR